MQLPHKQRLYLASLGKMKKRDETLDYILIGCATTIIPLLMLSINHPTMLGYAVVMILTTITLYRVVQKDQDKCKRDYIKRAIRERKNS
jgi:hypothetical protein